MHIRPLAHTSAGVTYKQQRSQHHMLGTTRRTPPTQPPQAPPSSGGYTSTESFILQHYLVLSLLDTNHVTESAPLCAQACVGRR